MATSIEEPILFRAARIGERVFCLSEQGGQLLRRQLSAAGGAPV